MRHLLPVVIRDWRGFVFPGPVWFGTARTDGRPPRLGQRAKRLRDRRRQLGTVAPVADGIAVGSRAHYFTRGMAAMIWSIVGIVWAVAFYGSLGLLAVMTLWETVKYAAGYRKRAAMKASCDVTGHCESGAHGRCTGRLLAATGLHWFCACTCHPVPTEADCSPDAGPKTITARPVKPWRGGEQVRISALRDEDDSTVDWRLTRRGMQ